jgi:hyperosmotically inducible periplasmic protein
MKRFLTAIVAGGALAYFLDPNTGARRRNIARDKLLSTFRRTGRLTEGKARFAGGTAFGIAKEVVPHRHDNTSPDDNTLKDRVESELGRDPKFDHAPINFNVEDGVVVVRGELSTQGDIDALVKRIKGIRDVKGVESYLHLPGTPAPNKEEALRVS